MMKKLILGTILLSLTAISCHKNKCAECHYDGPNGEVPMGVYCGDSLRDIEEVGTYTDSLGATYVVHCGEH